MSLRIGTRASALAQWQAGKVRELLAAQGTEAELVLIRTSGDRQSEAPLRVLGGKGIFVKELEDALVDGRIDLAVHSMKDVPTELPEGLVIAAICEREDVRDVLISCTGAKLAELPSGARIGTSSLRRQAQLLHWRPDLRMVEMRGNVETRIAKMERGDCDAVVLAKAGLDRLRLAHRITEVLPQEISMPAAGQGAIGVEARRDDRAVLCAVALLDHVETRVAVDAERIVLADLEGGCLVPLGVWARAQDREIVVEACVLSPDGSEALRVRRAGPGNQAEKVGHQVATALRESGAERLLHPLADHDADRR
jgi:hydroxymethylbilane synthase